MSNSSDPFPSASNTSHKRHKYILITNGESYVGYALANYIADQLAKREGQLKKKHWRVRVLCEHKENLIHLEQRGIDVCKVDYESPHMIRECMKDKIKVMVLTPFAKQNILSQGKNLLDCASEERIKRVLMISSMGCQNVEEEDKQSPMRQLKEVEDHLHKVYSYGRWIVFRLPFIQQFMYFWSHMVEHKSVIGMPMHKTNMLSTVNMNDVCKCVAQVCLSKKAGVWGPSSASWRGAPVHDNSSSDINHELNEQDAGSLQSIQGLKRVYELMGIQPMSISMIAEALTKALRHTGFTDEIEPAKLEDDQLESYLKSVSQGKAQDFKELAGLWADITPYPSLKDKVGIYTAIKSYFVHGTEASASSHNQLGDPKYLYPCPPTVLTPFGIHLILGHFKTARLSQEPILPSNDIRDISGREPIELADFFMSNRDQFRGEDCTQ